MKASEQIDDGASIPAAGATESMQTRCFQIQQMTIRNRTPAHVSLSCIVSSLILSYCIASIAGLERGDRIQKFRNENNLTPPTPTGTAVILFTFAIYR
ncbi:hypothetical protein EVAR_88110_1 [Eumeta japonica]|uniref:Uncharacterized protein n=1 Tax=Eumeta variegata TaxID=151549 RepID=A0A4C2A3T7_EUMVA|nr:hypothetical protein EVAR_88110_1 [Eumeta japonica]